MITKEDFIEKAMECIPTEKEMRETIEKALEKGLVNLSVAPDNFMAVYQLVGAMLEMWAGWAINGSSYEATRRQMRRKANFIKRHL